MPLTHFFYEAAGRPEVLPDVVIGSEVCCLCGQPVTQFLLRKKAIPDTFTDHDVFRNLEGKAICLACAYTIKSKMARQQSCLVTEDHIFVYSADKTEKKTEVERSIDPENPRISLVVLPKGSSVLTVASQDAPLDRPFFLSIQDGQNPKHKLLRTRMNYNGKQHGFFYNRGTKTEDEGEIYYVSSAI